MLQPSSTTKKSTTVRSTSALRLTRAALQTTYFFSENLGTTFSERLFTTPRHFDRPKREIPLLARAREMAIPVQLRSPIWGGERITVNAWKWGVGPTVLLVHGWEGRGAQLGDFVEPLIRAGMSVVTFDAPAHGDTDGKRAYLTDFADAVIDVAAAVGPLHGIVAHSFGAAAVLLAKARGNIEAPRNAFISPSVQIPEFVAQFCSTLGLGTDERVQFETQVVEHAGVPFEALTLPVLVGKRETAALIFHDREDKEVPFAAGEALHAQWPHSRFIPTGGLGHRRILRDPSVIADVVAHVSEGVPLPASDLVREVDRHLDAIELESAP